MAEKVDAGRWTGGKWVVITGPNEPYGAPEVWTGIESSRSGFADAETAIRVAKRIAASLPGREVCVYERAARFMAEVGPVEEIME